MPEYPCVCGHVADEHDRGRADAAVSPFHIRCHVLGHRARRWPKGSLFAICTRCPAIFLLFYGHWIETAWIGKWEPVRRPRRPRGAP